MRTTIEIPYAVAARGVRPREKRAEPFLLGETATIAVEVRAAADLRPAVTVGATPRNGYPETVWAMDGRLWRPVELDRGYDGRAGRRVRAETACDDVLATDGYDFTDWRREVPTACLPEVCFDARGDFDRDYTAVRERFLKGVEHRYSDDAERRLAVLSETLLVVDGEIWTECPMPPCLVVDDPAQGPYAVVASDLNDLTVVDPDRAFRQIFRLDRLDEARAWCAAVSPGADPGFAPVFELHDPEAAMFDDLVATARMVAAPTVDALSRDLAWFGAGALEDFAVARSAARRLLDGGGREDAYVLFEAFGRMAQDPGDPCGLFEPPTDHALAHLARFGMRAAVFEHDVSPDLAPGAPTP